ncbi:MAG TPA: carboxypeptidase regulatory-like domain-containing protein [Candidatus Krumholzibacteria bacterium]|nr:carboxypeptidase regulatory-like domain-containing protein [Candidatus Krumholzibacteria bacterium]
MSNSPFKFRRHGRCPRRPRWWLVLIPVLWSILAAPAVAGELRGKVRIVTDVAVMQSSTLDPYAGTLNSAGASGASHAGHPHGTTPLDVVVYLEGPGVAQATPTDGGKPQLKQINQSFEPHVLGVPVGTTVDFPNGDLVYHNVFSYSKTKRFDLGYYGKGKSKQVTFDKPGIVQVFCDIHSTMSAYVLVVDSPLVTQPDRSGAFDFPDLPPGTYTVRIWHPDIGDRSTTVTVGDGVTDCDVNL